MKRKNNSLKDLNILCYDLQVYDGRTPTVFISDPTILRIIQSRDFEYFKSHRKFLETEHPIMSEVLDFLDGIYCTCAFLLFVDSINSNDK